LRLDSPASLLGVSMPLFYHIMYYPEMNIHLQFFIYSRGNSSAIHSQL
jgi:hypothetical protein